MRSKLVNQTEVGGFSNLNGDGSKTRRVCFQCLLTRLRHLAKRSHASEYFVGLMITTPSRSQIGASEGHCLRLYHLSFVVRDCPGLSQGISTGCLYVYLYTSIPFSLPLFCSLEASIPFPGQLYWLHQAVRPFLPISPLGRFHKESTSQMRCSEAPKKLGDSEMCELASRWFREGKAM